MASSGSFIFVSHCPSDQDEAGRIVAHYEAQGIRMWWGPRDIQAGRDLNQQVGWAVQNCAGMLVVVSEACRGAIGVRAETDQAARAGKPLFLVRMSDVYLASDMPALASARLSIDAFGPNAQANVGRLTQELQNAVRMAGPGFGGPPPQPAFGAPPASAGGAWGAPTGGQPGFGPGPGGMPPGRPAGGPIDGEREQMLRAYVRDNADYYLGKWRQMDASRGKASFNFAAFFLNCLWLIYRKNYGLGIGLLAGILVVNLILLLISPFLAPFVSLASIGIAIWIGVMGNSIYRAQAEREVAKAAAMHPDPHGRMSALARRGGTNAGAAIGVFIGAMVVNTGAILGVAGMSGAFDQPTTTYASTSSTSSSSSGGSGGATRATPTAATSESLRLALIGRWSLDCQPTDATITFSGDGSFVFDGDRGTWSVAGDEATLNHSDGEVEILHVEAIGNELRFRSNEDPNIRQLMRCTAR